jgi:hypothetical protein
MRARHLILCALLSGCPDGGPVTNPTNCPSGTCTISQALGLAVEVVPASTSTNTWALPSQEVSALTIDTKNGSFTLLLEAPVKLSGTLRTQNAGATAVAGDLTATRPSRIVGRPDVYYQTKVDPMTGNWSLVVSPTHDGEVYTLHVLPTDDTIHPPESFLVEATADNSALDLALADPLSLLQIHGVVTDAVQQPVAGAAVQVVDPTTRATLSTTTSTDAQGNFVVKVAPPPTALGMADSPAPVSTVLLVAEPPKNATLPRLEVSVDTSHIGPANSLTVNLQVPPLPAPTQLVYTVQGVGPNGKAAAVVAAHCVFSADVSDPKSGITATYETFGDTDADGKTAVTLLPASDGTRDYSVAVTPPASADFQALLTDVQVGPSGGYAAPIQLAQRDQVAGRVVGPDGQPVKNLTVVPTPATVADALKPSTTNALAPKLPSTLTDAMGRFVLRVDAGGYDLNLIPPPTSGLPRLWVDRQMVSTDVTLPDIKLPHGAMVHGQIEDSMGAPLVGAAVRFYTVASSNAACQTGDYTCLAPPRLLAEANTGMDGSVGVLLPAQ